MGCCGEGRRQWQSSPKRLEAVDKLPPPVLEATVDLEYRGDTSIVMLGPVTGFTYVFPRAGEMLGVDNRDVAGLLSSGEFSRSDGG